MNLFKTYIIRLLAGIAVLFCATLPASARSQSEWADSVIRRAMESYNDGSRSSDVDDLYTLIRKAENSHEIPDSTMAKACLILANIYLNYGDYPSAVKFYKKGLKFPRSEDMKLSLINNLAVTNCILGNEKEARFYSSQIAKLKPRDRARQQYDRIIAEAFIEKTFGSRRRSVTLFKKAITESRRMGMDTLSFGVTPISELSEYYERHGPVDSALYWLHRYENLVACSGSGVYIANAQQMLLRVYIATGDRDKALEYCKKYVATIDSLVDTGNFITVSSKAERAAEEEDRSHIEDLEITVSKQKLLLFAIAGLVIAGAIVWFWRRRIRHDRKLLFDRNREIAILESGAPGTPPDTTPEQHEWNELMARIEETASRPETFCDPDFSLAELAKLVGSNTRYVSQAINETKGENFRSYINRFRIREARNRLTNDARYEHLTIQSIGESVGFRSVSNFNIAFKKMTGMTPSLYQKMTLEEKKKGSDE